MLYRFTGAAIYLLVLTGCASDPPAPPPPEPSPYANATVREGYHVASNDTVAVPTQRTFLVVDGDSAHGIAAAEKETPVQDLTEADLPPAPKESNGGEEEAPNRESTSEGGDQAAGGGSPAPAAGEEPQDAESVSDTDVAADARRGSDASESPTREAAATSGVPAEVTARQLRAWETYCDQPKGMTAEDWDIISRFDGIPAWVKNPGPGIEEPLRSHLQGCTDMEWN